jgi:hypothetical protein
MFKNISQRNEKPNVAHNRDVTIKITVVIRGL